MQAESAFLKALWRYTLFAVKAFVSIVSLLLLAVFAHGFYDSPHPVFETWRWHHSHGDADAFADYVIPVPRRWRVQDFDANSAMLLRLDSLGDIHVMRAREIDEAQVEEWQDEYAKILRKNGHVDISIRTIDLNGEKLACVGGQSLGEPFVAVRTWLCRTRALGVSLAGTNSELPEEWEIVSGIRRKQ